MKPLVIVCLSQPFHIRNIVYSPFFAELRAAYDVTLVVPVGFAVPLSEAGLVEGCAIRPVRPVLHRFEGGFAFLRKSVFAGRERTQTFNLISEQERAGKTVRYAIAGALNSVLGRFEAPARAWRGVEGRLIPGTEFDAVVGEKPYSAVITANYGTDGTEARLIRAARRAGIPSVAIVPSWDNLTSKGVIAAMPDHLVVWNETMRSEADRLYGFPPDRIHIAGGLQFDHHMGAADAPLPYPIPDGVPVVVYGTITPRYFRYNTDVIEVVAEKIRDGALPPETRLVVRLHPQVVDPVFGDDLAAYRVLADRYNFVHLSMPDVAEWGPLKAPSFSDFSELIALLKRASAVVAPASTIAIDAAAVDTPMIGLGFDGHRTLPYEQSVRRMFDFTHYRPLMQTGAIELALSADDLVRELKAYIADPSLRRDARRRVVEELLTFDDGRAHTRVMDVVREVGR